MSTKRRFANPRLRLLDKAITALEERVTKLEAGVSIPREAAVGTGDDGATSTDPPGADDQPADDALQAVADALSPPRYYLKGHTHGWYTVHSGETGAAVHEGKLRRADADQMLQELLRPSRLADDALQAVADALAGEGGH
jgi:hypothetical protein